MRKNKKLFIIFLLVLISIGFAYLTSTLEINGIAGIGRNSWNIYFDNVVHLTGEDLATTKPTTTGTNTKNLTYSVTLNKPGDAYRFNVDIVNGGTIDAMITVVSNTSLTAEQAQYVEYSVTYADETALATKNLLAKNSRDKLLVSVVYKDNVSNDELLDEDLSIDIDLSIKYEQADNTASARSAGQLNVKFDYNYNLIPELEDTSNSVQTRADYSIKNEKITVTSKIDDGYIYLENNVLNLDSSKKYYFSSEIDGTWGNSGDTQELYIVTSSQYSSGPYIYIKENEKYFQTTTTEEYRFRFDVNQNEAQHSFWNLFLTEYTESNFNAGANLILPTSPTRSGYTFAGWYTERVGGTQVTTSTKANYSTTYYAHWTEA